MSAELRTARRCTAKPLTPEQRAELARRLADGSLDAMLSRVARRVALRRRAAGQLSVQFFRIISPVVKTVTKHVHAEAHRRVRTFTANSTRDISAA